MSLYTDASLIMFPSGYKEDKIYSLKPTDGSGDLTFTRASTATRVNADGLIETSPVNLASYSEQFDNAYWAKYSCTITANTTETTAPNGTNSADIFVSANATASSGIEGNIAYINGGQYTVSIFAKYKNTPFIQMLAPSFVTADFVNFNIQTGAIVGGSYSQTPTITSVGNGWYRCSFTYVSNYTGTTAISPIFLIDSASATRGQAFTGDGVKGAYIYGAQVNIGATAKPYFPTTDRLNVPRIDYTGGGCGKLLLEKQSTNIILRSEEFENASWTQGGITIAANDTTSPDGTTNADKITEDSSNGLHVVYNTSPITASATSTVSVFYKKGTRQYFSIKLQIGSSSYTQVFDADGVTTGGSSSNGLTSVSTSIVSMGNGWVRASVAGTSASGTSTYAIIGLSNSLNPTLDPTNFNPTYQGSVTDYGYFYGAQLEAGSYSTSYIPTLASSVTRLADSAILNNSSALPTSYPFTLFVESNIKSECVLLSLLDSTNSAAYYSISYYGGFSATARPNGTSTNAEADGPYPVGNYKIAAIFTASSIKLFVNGSLAVTAGAPDSFNSSINDLLIGQLRVSSDTGQRANNSKTLIFKSELTESQAIELTTL